jgi:hypothetical protein
MYGITTVQQERAMRNDDQNVILGRGAVWPVSTTMECGGLRKLLDAIGVSEGQTRIRDTID